MSPPDPSFLQDYAETRGYLLGRPSRVQVTADGSAVLFLRSRARDDSHDLFETDLATGRTRLLVRPGDLLEGKAEELSPEEKARRERQRIVDRGFSGFVLSPDGGAVLLSVSGRLFLLNRRTGAARTVTRAEADPPLDARFSPDGARIAFVRGGNLYVQDLDQSTTNAAPRPITTGGDGDLFFGLAEFVAQEEMGRLEGYWWSPSGDRLAYAEVDQRRVETFCLADPVHPERAPAVFRYPRAGRANARVRLGIASAAAGPVAAPATTWIKWDRERYPYVARVCWTTPKAPLSLLVQSRDQREIAFLAVDEQSGATRTLLTETDEAWVNLERDLPRWLPNGKGFLWCTERLGSKTLELRRPDGRLERQVVDQDAGFLALRRISADSQTVHVLLGDALYARLARVELAAAVPMVLTTDEADRTVELAANAEVAVETCTTADDLPQCRVLDAKDGRILAVVPSVAEPPPFVVNLTLETTEGDPDLHAAVIRPRAFDRKRRYPVVLHVYGGPHSQMVRADQRFYLLDQWIADQGAVVVCLDNRGTPRRGRAWERAIKGRFGDLPLGDQVAGLEALARRHPELDLSRVGVYGWSFGGYLAALAVLRRPDLFKVGVAGAPVVDWRDYDTHYTERYLGLPHTDRAGYDAASLLEGMGRPSGAGVAGPGRRLLVVHGTADDNVYFFHALKLAEALFRAGQAFDFLPLPGVTHQVADPRIREQLWRRTAQYLLDALLALPETKSDSRTSNPDGSAAGSKEEAKAKEGSPTVVSMQKRV